VVYALVPHRIQVFAPDGTSVLVNKAILAEYHFSSMDEVVGKYNVFKDPTVHINKESKRQVFLRLKRFIRL